MEKQLEFSFAADDRPCRTCKYWWRAWGASNFKSEDRWLFGCRIGGFKMTPKISLIPNSCKMWMLGGERMAFVDFKKMSEEQLRKELDKIRSERRGSGKRKRVQSRDRRISGSQKERKPKDIIRL